MSDSLLSGRAHFVAPERRAEIRLEDPTWWLLLLLALRDATRALDPVRVQIAMFLFAIEEQTGTSQSYAFEPREYGPFSGQIVQDLDTMMRLGLIEAERAEGYRWSRYKIGVEGLRVAQDRVDQLNAVSRGSLRTLFAIKERLLATDLSDALGDVRRLAAGSPGAADINDQD